MSPTPGVKPYPFLPKYIHPARLLEMKPESSRVIIDGYLHDDPMELSVDERDKAGQTLRKQVVSFSKEYRLIYP
jgi:hypothetical protein